MELYSENLGVFAEKFDDKRLPSKLAVKILSAVAKSLAAMHPIGIEKIHRDLKPANILLQVVDGVVSKIAVADYGLVIARKNQMQPRKHESTTKSRRRKGLLWLHLVRNRRAVR